MSRIQTGVNLENCTQYVAFFMHMYTHLKTGQPVAQLQLDWLGEQNLSIPVVSVLYRVILLSQISIVSF